jgi:hypothetical protein
LAVLLRTLGGLEQGEMEPQRATAIAAVARAIVTTHEVSDLEQRLTALEAAADMRRQNG